MAVARAVGGVDWLHTEVLAEFPSLLLLSIVVYRVGVMPKTPRRGAGGRGGTRGRVRGRAARGCAVRGRSRGGASVAASSASTSTSGPVTLVQSSSSAGPARLSATVTSASGTPGRPLVVGDLAVSDLLQLIRDEVRQSSLAVSSPPLTLPAVQSTALAGSTGLSGRGPEVPGEWWVRVGGVYVRCLSWSRTSSVWVGVIIASQGFAVMSVALSVPT